MGMQVSYRMDTSIEEEIDIRRIAEVYWGSLFKDLASQKECEVLEGHLRSDHVHMLISIPPKYAVSQVVGFIKGK